MHLLHYLFYSALRNLKSRERNFFCGRDWGHFCLSLLLLDLLLLLLLTFDALVDGIDKFTVNHFGSFILVPFLTTCLTWKKKRSQILTLTWPLRKSVIQREMDVQNISRNASNITKEANEWDVESLSCYHFKSVHYSIGEFSLVWYIISFVVNGVVQSIATVINLLILLAISKTPSLHSPSNTLLFGLALSDLGVGLIVHPLFLLHMIGKLARNKDVFCHAGIAAEIAANALCIISLLTVTAVSLDRYLALQLHLRYKQLITIKRVTLVIGFIWVAGTIIGSVWLYKPEVIKFAVMATIAICLMAATYSYFKIYRAVSRHYFSTLALQCSVQQYHVDQAVNLAKFKARALSTFWVYCLIIVCYFPYFCVVIAIMLRGLSTTTRFWYEMTAILIFINSFLNPLVFCWRLREIRHAVKKSALNIVLRLSCKTESSN